MEVNDTKMVKTRNLIVELREKYNLSDEETLREVLAYIAHTTFIDIVEATKEGKEVNSAIYSITTLDTEAQISITFRSVLNEEVPKNELN